MKTENMYRILVLTIFVLLMTVGIYIGVEITDKDKKITEINNNNPEVVVSNTDSVYIYDEQAEIIQEEEIIEVNVKFTDVYPDCGHSIEAKNVKEKQQKQKLNKK